MLHQSNSIIYFLFCPGFRPWTPLGELTTHPRSLVGSPPHTLPLDAFGIFFSLTLIILTHHVGRLRNKKTD